MTNIVYVIKKHILVRLFLAITLCVVTAMLLGSGFKTQAANSLGNFDQPIIVKNSAIANPDNGLAQSNQSNQAAQVGVASQAQPVVATSLDKALRSLGSSNQSAAVSAGGAGAKAGDKAAADKVANTTSVVETVATPPATPKK